MRLGNRIIQKRKPGKRRLIKSIIKKVYTPIICKTKKDVKIITIQGKEYNRRE
jgi:hypothetical protein